MKMEQRVAHAPRTKELAEELMNLRTPCVGCSDCSGMCEVLMDVVTIPKTVLKEPPE